MKTTIKHFKLFQRYFKKYQKEFGLTGYNVRFFRKKMDDCYAEILVNQDGKVARVNFSTNWIDRKITNIEIKENALHECLHLLISRIVWLGTCRYIDDQEIPEEEESLVVKLSGLLKDEKTKN